MSVPFGEVVSRETIPYWLSVPASDVVSALSVERTTRLFANPKPMSAWHINATSVADEAATPDRYSPSTVEQGSGRLVQVAPLVVTAIVSGFPESGAETT